MRIIIIIIEHRSHQFRKLWRRGERETRTEMKKKKSAIRVILRYRLRFGLCILWFSKIIIAHCVPICDWDFITDAFMLLSRNNSVLKNANTAAAAAVVCMHACMHCIRNCWCIVCRVESRMRKQKHTQNWSTQNRIPAQMQFHWKLKHTNHVEFDFAPSSATFHCIPFRIKWNIFFGAVIITYDFSLFTLMCLMGIRWLLDAYIAIARLRTVGLAVCNLII